ncbi:amidohydrolase family protein [bacterium]|nr:amidohydrolase family protein [bacterium]
MPPPYLNAHCHLELSHLKGRLRGDRPFPEWLQDIVRLKMASTPEESAAGARSGLARLRETGTTVLFDILSMDTAHEAITEAEGLRSILFREVAGFAPNEAEMRLDAALLRQEARGALPPGAFHGLSPHAPYTVTPELFRLVADTARRRGQWLCIHAAEVAEETEMLRHGTGPMHDFLHRWLPSGWKPPGLRPIELLYEQSCLGPGTLLAHCNDVTDSDIELIRRTETRVVVCPGTHVYFGRGAFPLARLLAAGVRCYLGTDSLASNEDLDMAREVRLAFELCEKRIPLEQLEELASAGRAVDFLPGATT